MALRDNFIYRIERFVKSADSDISLSMPVERGKQLLFTTRDGLLFCPAFARTCNEYCGGISTYVSIPKNITEVEGSTLLSLFARAPYENLLKFKTKEGVCYVGNGIIMDEDLNILALGGTMQKYDYSERKWYIVEGRIVVDSRVFDVNASKVYKFIAKEFMAAAAWKAMQGMTEYRRGNSLNVNISMTVENMNRYIVENNVPDRLKTLKEDVKQCLLSHLESN